MRTRRVIQWAAGIGGIAVVAWLFLRPEAIQVETTAIRHGTLLVTLDEEGETRVRDRYVVAAPVSGALARIGLKAGDSVAAGQPVAWLSPAPLDPRASQQAAARLDAAMDACRAAEAQVTTARAALEQARRTLERADSLATSGLLAPEEREQAQLAVTSREQEVVAAEARSDATQHEVEVARAAYLGASRGARLVVRSPVAGRVLRVVEESERVVPVGAPLLEVGNPGRIEIVADYLSSDAVQIAPGDTALVQGWGDTVQLRARVRLVEPSGFTKVSALGVEEQRVNVVADFIDPPGRLGDRYRVEMRVIVARGDSVLLVPVAALFRAGEEWRVFLVQGGRAGKRSVTLGLRGTTEAEVVSGLTEGEVVVRFPGDRVRDGVRVRDNSKTGIQ
ncbi:MAG: efflux RND transporter periplasmic adaptor subunit [Gemmatimonadota bacterium]|nr:efflux RND transporter periplasmic adaptor subunit [Gemmatimonadota bacterium]MDH4347592.1 efflux RND transporter periplasmic adaptor subunit [Gemmatimonadota bacterium]MDH5283398.1 efflux RND transporter periplasmic adaptor subunit [Gemmatimonadota bacterium]